MTRPTPEGVDRYLRRSPARPEGLPGRTNPFTSLPLSFKSRAQVGVPSEAAQFPKWPLLGRCRLRVSSEPAKTNISTIPPPWQAQSQPRFRDPKEKIANQLNTGLDAENPEKATTEVDTLSGFPNSTPVPDPEEPVSDASSEAVFPLLQS